MNRQIRREQAKLDKKAAKEKERKRAARRRRLQSIRERKPARSADSGGSGRGAAAPRRPVKDLTPEQRRKLPGRFSGVLMIATVFFIVLQAAVPTTDGSTLTSITGAGFFLLFGYFSVLYLERRGAARTLILTLVSGLLLVAGVTVARLVRPELGMDWLMMGLAAPGVVAGALLGRLVFYNTPG